MKRGDIYWTEFDPPAGRRPAVIVTRAAALRFLDRITVAPLTRHVRGIPTEVVIEPRPSIGRSAVSCDNLQTVKKSRLDPRPVARLSTGEKTQLDVALVFALGIGS